MNDPLALDEAYRLLWRWTLGSMLLFLSMQFALRHGWVTTADMAAPALLTFGFTHVMLGLALLFRTRSGALKHRPRPDGLLYHMMVGDYLVSTLFTGAGILLVLWTSALVLMS